MNVVNKVINKIKLFLYPQKEFCFILKSFLGYTPIDIKKYELALSSKSMGIKDAKGQSINNERLELLGDSILDAVVADILYHHFPHENEGKLTEAKSKLVKREMLDLIARKMNMKELLFAYSPMKMEGSHVYGNALEALIGAIYLDKGYHFTHCFVQEKIIKQFTNLEVLMLTDENYKSQLLEWGQKNKIDVRFQLIDERHTKGKNLQFRSEVILQGLVFELGIGASKKESEQNAAKHALKRIKKKETYYLQVYFKTIAP